MKATAAEAEAEAEAKAEAEAEAEEEAEQAEIGPLFLLVTSLGPLFLLGTSLAVAAGCVQGALDPGYFGYVCFWMYMIVVSITWMSYGPLYGLSGLALFLLVLFAKILSLRRRYVRGERPYQYGVSGIGLRLPENSQSTVNPSGSHSQRGFYDRGTGR